MSTMHFQVVSSAPMELGECPLWHPEEKALYWIDIAGQAVHRYVPKTGAQTVWPMPSEPGCIAWNSSGGMIVALRSGMALLDTIDGSLTEVAPSPYDKSKLRFNDGRCDALGRFWVGTLYEPRDQPLGGLYCLDHAALSYRGNPVTVSNGVAFSPDAKTLYHADTTAHRICAYAFDLQSGKIGSARVLKEFSTDKSAADYGGRPDGAAVDCEGAYWCAMFEGGRILRLSPFGEVLSEIKVPMRCPTMVAFGGDDLRTLYITTARHNRPASELAAYPLSGSVLSVRVDVQGQKEFGFVR